ncbi:MAG: DNA-binding domain-containing protein [Pseudomonadota bacterium]
MTDQQTFLATLRNSESPIPPGLLAPGGRPAGKRFDVYRNNVAVSLVEALESGFPVVRKLVGNDFFQAMAGVYWRAHPPKSPVLTLYGDDFAAFLDGFPPAASVPYLADIARLEYALRLSYHAADTVPIDPAHLMELPAEQLMRQIFGFAPAIQMIASRWPIFGIWRANTSADAPATGKEAETVLITRPEFDPNPIVLSAGEAAFVDAMIGGASLGDAAEIGASKADFVLAEILGHLLAQGAITSLEERPKP